MKPTLLRKITVSIAVFVFCASLLLPAYAAVQGIGRGQAKKSQKFINGHDARSGRWDGRGPKPKPVWTSGHRGRRGWMIRRHRRHNRVS